MVLNNMLEVTEEIIKLEFKKYKMFFIQEFIKSLLPIPVSKQGYKYVNVKTLEGYDICVWGISLADLWNQFRRFINLRVFI